MQGIIKSIRQAFSKASISVSSTGISVIFTGNCEVSQSLNTYAGDFCWVFEKLVYNCDSISLKFYSGSIQLDFRIKGISSNHIVYTPLISDSKNEEFDSVSYKDGKIPDIVMFLNGVDINDNEEILEKLNAFFELEDNQGKSNILSFDNRKSLGNLKELIEELTFDDTDICVIQPVYGEFDGSVEVQFDSSMGNIEFSGNSKKCLSNAISMSSNVDIEIGEEFDSMAFVFYI